jgi:hypothetical protein
VGTSHHLDCFGLVAVTGDGAQLVGVGAHHVGEGVRVRGVALGPGHALPLAVTSNLQRIDREYPVARRDQRDHPWTAIGFDADHHLVGLVIAQVMSDQFVKLGDAGQSLREAGLGQPPSRLVLHLDVVVVLGPVVSDEQQPVLRSPHVPPRLRQPAEESPAP